MKLKLSYLTVVATVVAACGTADLQSDAPVLQGPPVTNVATPYDRAIACLAQFDIAPSVVSVGAITDETGKETFSDGGNGKFVTQGAGDIVQTAMVQSGVATVVNRRDPRVIITELQWGIRDTSQLIPADYFVTGSINTLDFIPGGGIDVNVAGVGARYRQFRALVGLDLALSNTSTGEVVAVTALKKQIVADEVGANVGRFFGTTLVDIDLGTQQREAMQFALRGMLYFATFELLSQLYGDQVGTACRAEINQLEGIGLTITAPAGGA